MPLLAKPAAVAGHHRALVARAWLAWLGFVVYGSLLPFEFRALPWDAVWQRFASAPFLQLGVESRADWIANGVLYLPVGLLGAWALGAASAASPIGRALRGLAALAVGGGLALAVEMAQVCFPPRTVSQNDLIAEALGTLIGVLLMPAVRGWALRWRPVWAGLGRPSTQRLLEAYLLAATLLALFPFDLLLSAGEWQRKLDSALVGWLWAPSALERGALLPILLGVEAALALPVGWWWAAQRQRQAPRLGQAAAVGAAWGLLVELLQLTIASGVTQGMSVLTRAAGVGLGVWCHARLRHRRVADWSLALRPWLPLAALPYLAVLVAAQGILGPARLDLGHAAENWASLRWLPFYYHYYTTEAAALFSLSSVLLMYLPVAAMAWVARLPAAGAALIAALLAGAMELVKLPFRGLHPDPTNVLIAAVGVWAAVRLLPLLGASLRAPAARAEGATVAQPRTAPGADLSAGGDAGTDAGVAGGAGAAALPQPLESAGQAAGEAPSARGAFAWRVGALLLALAALLSALTLPRVAPAALAAAVVVGATACARPAWAWAMLVALLPLLDLAPWSGRVGWGEIDAVMLAAAAGVCAWRATHKPAPGLALQPWLPLALLLGLSALGAAWRGLGADSAGLVAPPDALRGLVIARGAGWALLMAWLGRTAGLSLRQAWWCLACGSTLGLLGMAGVVLWERHAFVGLLNFADVYRVSGPLSAMHVGGVSLEAALVVGLLLALAVLVGDRRLAWRGVALLALLGGLYALYVTYSRHAYAAWAAGLAVCALASLQQAHAGQRRALLWGLMVAMAVAAWPALQAGFAAERLARSVEDGRIRLAHWQDALALRAPDLATRWLGEGLGSYPAAHHWRSAEPVRAGAVRVMPAGQGAGLRLGPGAPVYVERFVAVRPGQRVELDLRWRAQGTATLGLATCEKWLMTSRRCASARVGAAAGAGTGPATVNGPAAAPVAWQTARVRLDGADWRPGEARWRPVKLSLYHAGGAGLLEVASVALRVDGAAQPLRNGDFSSGMDEWFFSADSDLPWHVHSTPVQAVLELGWAGAGAAALLIALALWRAARATWRGGFTALFTLSCLVALAITGALNTLTDDPRLVCLLVSLIGFALAASPPRRHPAAGAPAMPQPLPPSSLPINAAPHPSA